MRTAGGRVSTVIDGVAYSARGEITLDPSNIEVEAAANQDGTVYRTVKPKPVMAQITFHRWLRDATDQPAKWSDNLMLLENIAVTFVEEDLRGTTHLLTGACFTGKPEHNLATGEVSGLGIAADSYETIR